MQPPWEVGLITPAPTSTSPAVTGCSCATETVPPVFRPWWKSQSWVVGAQVLTGPGSEPTSAPRAGMRMPCHQLHHATDRLCHQSPIMTMPAPSPAWRCSCGSAPWLPSLQPWLVSLAGVRCSGPHQWRPAALASSPPPPGPQETELGATPTLRMPQARFRGLAALLWEWLAEQPSGSALPGSGHQAQRHSFILTEPIAFRKLLRIGPSARILLSAQEPVVGSLLTATTVIGSSLAPLGACPLVSMATPLLSKHKGASFYEIIKPNFAVWVHIHSRGPWDTRDQARK